MYSHRHITFFSEKKQHTIMCKLYGYLHHQNRPGYMSKPPNESFETSSSLLELVSSQGRKSKNSIANDFLSSCFTFQSKLFPKFVFRVEKLVTLLLFRQLPVYFRQNPLIILKISINQGSSQNFMTI